MIKMGALGLALMGGAWLVSQAGFGGGSKAARWDEKRNVELVATGDPAIDRARAKARAGLDGFLAKAEKPGPDDRNFAVKIALRGDGQIEHMWITAFQRSRDGFTGRLDNQPKFLRDVKAGQTVTFARGEIEDWMYREGSVMHGNFTACAILANRPADRERAEKSFGLRCEA